ncbi:MAG TPA: translation factor GTPase family protein [Caulobacteraceae bacterium]|nr:translation factor GTPase family protein [Caulobacteraceae bacterium]
MRTLNLGILAHVDAGKTSLTERLLYAAGVIETIGSVDAGSTLTDSLALERQRGITIKSAVASFVVGDVAVNLIDTPGHPDFIAEVERVLSVLDGAVLVISAVEGVQSQTRMLMRALQRLGVPTLIFVNKIDRTGARDAGVLAAIAETLTPAVVAMGAARDLGSRDASVTLFGEGDAGFRAALSERLADNDETIFAAFVEGRRALPYRRLRAALAAQTGKALVHPVFFGSAITGAGTDALIAGVSELLPASEGDADGPVSGAVFKIERGVGGEKVAFVRMFSGMVSTGDRVAVHGADPAKVTAISVFERGGAASAHALGAGRIGKLWGLHAAQIGDAIGAPRADARAHHFAPPSLETVIVPRHAADKGALHTALAHLAEQDPLINLRQDDIRQEMFVSLYGEVQKEVIEQTLAGDFGVEVDFRETTTICIERVIGTGAAVEWPPRPFMAAVGLRIDPAPIGTGVSFKLEVEYGALPLTFHKAVEEAVYETLMQGLHGWRVTDCTVAMTHAIRYRHFATSTPADHRNLTPLVLMKALKQAGTEVCEPIHRFQLTAPAEALGAILPALAKLGAGAPTPVVRGGACELTGEIRAAQVHRLQLEVPGLTGGLGVLEQAFDHYRPVRGAVPSRPRTDHNPLDRREYLRHVLRRV